MKILLIGKNGQVGWELQRTLATLGDVVAIDRQGMDLANPDSIRSAIRIIRPDLIANAAAYTAVDKAEGDEAAAQRLNADAVAHLAAAARQCGALLAHISTDFVFDGAQGTPYAPGAAPNPLSAYGRTKLAGERAAGADALILRTAWVYSVDGGNFVKTMLRLMAEREELRVVADQIGTPTLATGIATTLWALAGQRRTGMFHHTDSGAASWYDFAVAIHEEALAIGLLPRAVRIVPIATEDYPTPARRPAYSVLDKRATIAAIGAPAPHWRDHLRIMLKELKANG